MKKRRTDCGATRKKTSAYQAILIRNTGANSCRSCSQWMTRVFSPRRGRRRSPIGLDVNRSARRFALKTSTNITTMRILKSRSRPNRIFDGAESAQRRTAHTSPDCALKIRRLCLRNVVIEDIVTVVLGTDDLFVLNRNPPVTAHAPPRLVPVVGILGGK